jgi:hypothetical protein
MVLVKILRTFNLDYLCTKYGFETLFRTPKLYKNLHITLVPLYVKFQIPNTLTYLLDTMQCYILQFYL